MEVRDRVVDQCLASELAGNGRQGGHVGPPVRPSREHAVTCARAHSPVDALNRLAVTLGIPTLTDLGHENAAEGFRHSVKKLKVGELANSDKAFNAVIRDFHPRPSAPVPC
ncbi:hypothetical protein [Streptomyces yunnanensis]|uniref:hypothetical protein n=1 Tax=Streptomyces yunnanensis TaxID=156453 RepID=UPI0011614B2F|nr:hypothetical protein [Streptomyces yunnanensis]